LAALSPAFAHVASGRSEADQVRLENGSGA